MNIHQKQLDVFNTYEVELDTKEVLDRIAIRTHGWSNIDTTEMTEGKARDVRVVELSNIITSVTDVVREIGDELEGLKSHADLVDQIENEYLDSTTMSQLINPLRDLLDLIIVLNRM